MKEQVFLQLRVDRVLKEEAEKILEKIGIEMPTAIRMFLKRIIIEGGIPFETKMPEIAFHERELMVSNGESNVKERKIVVFPGIPAKTVSYTELLELLNKIPARRITRSSDIEKYLMKKYDAERIEFDGLLTSCPGWIEAPYWKVVSERGFLQDTKLCSRERQEIELMREGFHIVECGAHGQSLKVENYQNYLFNFDTLKE